MTMVLHYVAAFVLFCIGAFVRSRTPKQLLLLAGSYMFYASLGTGFLAILISSSVINFGLGKFLRKRPTQARLWLGVIANLALLSFFKYLPPLASSISADFLRHIIMPAGMSFWTFQALSYLFDIYRKEECAPTPVEFCLYLAFWPTVLMGPICRLHELLPQFRDVHGISSPDLVEGLRRIGMGLFMKLGMAQFLGSALTGASKVAANFVGKGDAWGGLDVWFVAIGFGFQLFFDFAGYSHIVIGAARLVGFRLKENFDSPFLSPTPSVFWTRWHMSLSSWIRDYVFVPASMLRREPWWRYVAVLLSMVLFGIWHGATLTFLLWGVYQGVLLVLHRLGQQYQKRTSMSTNASTNLLSWALTFLGISLSWVLFRTNDLNEALTMYRAVLSPIGYFHLALPADFYRVVLFSVTGYFAYWGVTSSKLSRRKWQEFRSRHAGSYAPLSWQKNWWWMGPAIATLTILAVLAVSYQASRITPFIYTMF